MKLTRKKTVGIAVGAILIGALWIVIFFPGGSSVADVKEMIASGRTQKEITDRLGPPSHEFGARDDFVWYREWNLTDGYAFAFEEWGSPQLVKEGAFESLRRRLYQRIGWPVKSPRGPPTQ